MSVFSERLKEAMEYRRFRQVDLVNRTKIDKGTISNYLKGKYVPKAAKAALIADALNVNLPWLLGYEGVPMEPEQFTEYSISHDGSMMTISYDEEAITNFTKEKWCNAFDEIMTLPEPIRNEAFKMMDIFIAMAGMQKKLQNDFDDNAE